MAGNLYESVFTRNKQLAEFFDQNHNAARMVKKAIGLIVRIAEDLHVPADKLDYEVYAPRGSEVIVVKINRPGSGSEKMKSLRDQGG